jgi:hypothetical protein
MKSLVRAAILAFATIPVSFALDVSQVKGTWKLDFDAFWKEMEKAPEAAAMPAEQKAKMKPMMEAMMGSMRMVITETTVGMSGGPDGKADTKKILEWKSTGPKTASVTVDDPQSKDPATLTLVDAKTLTLAIKQGDKTMTMMLHPADDAAPASATAPATK